MKIECDKCQAKYSIADEKVRGKTFKIRCKKCSNVIIVRNKDSAAAKDDGDVSEPAGEDAGDAGWHLAIDGETVGPVSEDELRQRYADGEIDKDTAVWQEGFEDWVALGDVDQFRDLPDPQPSAAPEPAAAVHGYSAGSSALATAPERTAAEPLVSPRVDGSRLTAQRNENSVLFSLDNLRAMATASVDTRPAPSLGLATTAPSSEGSGLIDIRALSGLTAAAPAPAREREDALPSFGGATLGGSSLGGLVSQPLVVEPVAGVAADSSTKRMTPIYVMMGVMMLLLVVLGGVLFSLLNREPPQERIVVREVPGKVADEDKDNDDKDRKKKDDDEDEDDANDGDKDDKDRGDKAGKSGTKVASASKSSRPSSKRSRSSSRSRSKPSSTRSRSRSGSDSGSSVDDIASGDVPKSSSSSSPSSGDAASDVDCLLDPSKCNSGGSKKSSSRSKPAASKPAASSGGNSNLPDALDRAALLSGFSKVKASAAMCGKKHGAPDGTKVKVKVSIQGSTGRVTSATPESPWGGKPLGNCVAAEVKKAQFDKFSKPQMGLVYSFRM